MYTWINRYITYYVYYDVRNFSLFNIQNQQYADQREGFLRQTRQIQM